MTVEFALSVPPRFNTLEIVVDPVTAKLVEVAPESDEPPETVRPPEMRALPVVVAPPFIVRPPVCVPLPIVDDALTMMPIVEVGAK